MVAHELQELDNGSKYLLEGDTVLFYDANAGYRKYIGRIKKGKLHGKDIVFFLKNEREKDRFHKLDAWTIPVAILDRVTHIYYQTEEDIYKITKDNAYQYGVFRMFNNEEKLCVPVRFWEQKSEMED